MTDPIDPETGAALAQILAGESTPDDHARLQAWVAEAPDRAHRIDLVYRTWKQADAPEHDGNVVAFLDKLHQTLASSFGKENPSRYFHVPTGIALDRPLPNSTQAKQASREHSLHIPTSSPSTPSSVRTRRLWYSGASLVAAVLLVFAGWRTASIHLSRGLAGTSSVYSTGNGQRATVVLPDGSSVILNVASRLEIPADYAAGNRRIQLTGEALFDVQHQTSHPLSVVAGPSVTRVLGTRFLVRHYATDTAATIAVHDGKVGVGDVILTASQQVAVSSSSHTTSAIQRLNPAQFSFASGILTLDAMSLQAAIPTLNRWYDTEIRIGSPELSAREIKGTFTAGSLSDLTEILKLAFDVRVVRNGRTLTLYLR